MVLLECSPLSFDDDQRCDFVMAKLRNCKEIFKSKRAKLKAESYPAFLLLFRSNFAKIHLEPLPNLKKQNKNKKAWKENPTFRMKNGKRIEQRRKCHGANDQRIERQGSFCFTWFSKRRNVISRKAFGQCSIFLESSLRLQMLSSLLGTSGICQWKRR